MMTKFLLGRLLIAALCFVFELNCETDDLDDCPWRLIIAALRFVFELNVTCETDECSE